MQASFYSPYFAFILCCGGSKTQIFLTSHPFHPNKQQDQIVASSNNGPSSDSADLSDPQQPIMGAAANNPLAAGYLVQLITPTRLRPFPRSVLHLRQGHELRLACIGTRGYPNAIINWYIGNRLVDAEFLQQQPNEYRILQLVSGSQMVTLATGSSSIQQQPNNNNNKRIVEVNPISFSRERELYDLIDYHDTQDERMAIETSEQQLKYMKFKLAQLTNQLYSQSSSSADGSAANSDNPLMSHASLSILIINSLDVERDSSRIACRAVTRANVDEVTTVIKVQSK